MSPVLSNTLLIFIIVTASFVVIGAIIAAVRFVRFTRRERDKKEAAKMRWMAEARELKKDTEATSD